MAAEAVRISLYDHRNLATPGEATGLGPTEPERFAASIREALTFEPDRLDPDLPPIPESVTNVEDLFTAAETVVTGRWIERISPQLAQRCQIWVTQIEQLNGEGPAFTHDIAHLTNQAELERKLQLKQFDLGPTKKALPDVWTSLLLASHERQRAQIGVLRHWSNSLTETQAAAIDATKFELEMLVDLADAATHLNLAYIRQEREKVGSTGGESLQCEAGEEFVYYLKRSADPASGETILVHTNYAEFRKSQSDKGEMDVEAIPFSQVYAQEVGSFVAGLRGVLRKMLTNLDQLPARYRPLPPVLAQIIIAYDTREVVPENVAQLWQEAKRATMTLAETDCPLIPLVQGDTTDLGNVAKVIPEFRLGWRTTENRDIEYYISHLQSRRGGEYSLRSLAQEAVAERDSQLAQEYSIPRTVIVDALFGTGSNIHWPTRGDSDGEDILAHPNAIKNIALAIELPLVRALLPDETVDERRFARAAVISVLLHEHGQAMFSTWADRVAALFENATAGYLLDEVKAETCGMLLYATCWDREVNLDYQHIFLAMFGRMADTLKGKSGEVGANGERYFYLAAPVIKALLSSGVLAAGTDVPMRLVGGTPEPPWIRGARILGHTGEEILANFYMYPGGNSQAAEDGLRRLKGDPSIVWFRQQLARLPAETVPMSKAA